MLALWTDVTRLRPGVREGELRHARRRHLGDDFQALDHARHDLVLEAGVQVLGVLAHEHQVDVLEPRRDARQVVDRPEVGVEAEGLAQAHVDAREAGADGRRERALEAHRVALDRVEERVGQRGAVALERHHARVVPFPLDLGARGRQDPDHGRRHFGPDAVAGDERDGVRHAAPHYTARVIPAIHAACGRLVPIPYPLIPYPLFSHVVHFSLDAPRVTGKQTP